MAKPVLLLLLLCFLSPVLLYTHIFANYEFVEESSFLISSGSKIRKLKIVKLESSNSLQEQVGTVYLDNSSKYVTDFSQFGLSGKDYTKSGFKERRTRELASTDNGSELETENGGIHQVVDGNVGRDMSDNLQQSDLGEEKEGKEDNETGEEEAKPNVSREISSGDSREKDKESSKGADSEKHIDEFVRRLQDQVIRARVFLGLGPIRRNSQLMKELRLRMKEAQRALGEASKDSDLQRSAYEKSKVLEQALGKAKSIQYDCEPITKKLRAMLQSTEELLRAQKKQATFLSQLTAKTLPKSLHCLPLRLSTEYYSLSSSEQEFPHQEKLEDPNLYHYALFSDNVLATAVVVNSTVFHAKEPENHVFHIVTDSLNYAAMRMWFLANPPGAATVQVQNVDEFTWLNASYSPVLKKLASLSMIDYYFKAHHSNSDPNTKFRNPKYLSILNHLRFYLPEIFPKLDKVLFLDDDVVVQKDLTSLWSIDLDGKVNGAVETCRERFYRYNRYLNFSNPLISQNFDPRACGWAYGMNVFDLKEWKKQNITEVYHTWQRLNVNRQLWKLGTLPPGLITFYNRTFSIDQSWHALGLGYDPTIDPKDIKKAAVIHYNGNLKPWLEVGIARYKSYWAKFVDTNQKYLRDCNFSL